MNLKRDKTGQFYLIAAIIIIAAIITLYTITNYIIKKESIKLYDLGEELGIESQNVLDYGTYSSKDEANMKILIENFIEKFRDYAGEGKNLYFIFGNKKKINVVAYQDFVEEVVTVSAGGRLPETLIVDGASTEYSTVGSEKVAITIGGAEYDFKLGNGENFYFVIIQEISGEKHVITNKNK